MGGEIRSIIDALASSLLPKIVGTIFGLFLILTFAIGIIQNAYTWTDASPPAIIDSIDVWRLGMVVGTTGCQWRGNEGPPGRREVVSVS